MDPISPTSPPLTHMAIVQLCFVTDNLEGSVEAFARLSGLTPGTISIAAHPSTPTNYKGSPSAVHARTQAFKLPNIDVEFLEPGPEPSTWRDALTAHGPTLHHIAFRTDDLAKTRSEIETMGLVGLQSADFVGGGGLYAVFDAMKTIGTMVEVFQVRHPM